MNILEMAENLDVRATLAEMSMSIQDVPGAITIRNIGEMAPTPRYARDNSRNVDEYLGCARKCQEIRNIGEMAPMPRYARDISRNVDEYSGCARTCYNNSK